MAKDRLKAIEDAIHAGPKGQAPTTRTPLGVPPDFKAKREVSGVAGIGEALNRAFRGQSPSAGVAPRYFTGDEWAPASKGPQYVAQLQKLMIEAGLIRRDAQFRIGVWDPVSRESYQRLLEFANGSGMSWEDALPVYAAGQSVNEEGPKRAPLTVKLSNPDDIVAVADEVARKKLGRRLTPQEAARMITLRHSAERQVQQTEYAMAETGGTMTSPLRPMEKLVEEIAPAEAGAHDIALQADEFFSLLRGIGGG